MQLKYLVLALDMVNQAEEDSVPGEFPPELEALRRAITTEIQSASPEMVGEFEGLLFDKIRAMAYRGYQEDLPVLVDLMKVKDVR